MSGLVDLRSDTVTRLTAAMYDAMMRAPVGDDGYGEDPSVNALQERIAGMLGFEDALFVPTGTQGNLCAILAHCARGDEYIVGQMAHCYRFEGGGAAVLGSVQPQPIENEADGTLSLVRIAQEIKPEGDHFASTRLLALENTLGGKVMPDAFLQAACELAAQRGIATHLDGARLFNAAVANALASGLSPEVEARRIASHFDSVSVCFSKGLGAPAGSALCGSREFIARARRIRRIAGGAMRQAGVLAAAAHHGLDHHVDRLARDHELARRLHQGLCDLADLRVEAPQTNIVFLELLGQASERSADLVRHLARDAIVATGRYQMRLVTHMDVDEAGIDRAIDSIRTFFKR
ncbi:MAG TPA: low-specificity L-threonine aldolase [Ramlibacter sp.]|nr:low-specificity L-threonine aldolase [Ramlibacter sp.]